MYAEICGRLWAIQYVRRTPSMLSEHFVGEPGSPDCAKTTEARRRNPGDAAARAKKQPLLGVELPDGFAIELA